MGLYLDSLEVRDVAELLLVTGLGVLALLETLLDLGGEVRLGDNDIVDLEKERGEKIR